MSVLVWYRAAQSCWSQCEVTGSLGLANVEGIPAVGDGVPSPDAVHVRLVEAFADVSAVALVPPSLDQMTRINGTPVSAGLHELRHADQIDVGEQRYWISTATGVRVVAYDPAIHRDEFCFLTKSRLHAGDEVIVCPGRPGANCEKIYRKDSWEMAMQSSTLAKCLNCEYRPALSQWTPPKTKERQTYHDILRIALQRGR